MEQRVFACKMSLVPIVGGEGAGISAIAYGCYTRRSLLNTGMKTVYFMGTDQLRVVIYLWLHGLLTCFIFCDN
jgi:hypothetical protein